MMKGASGNFGATALYNASASLELALKNKEYGKVDGFFQEFSITLKTTADTIQKIMPPLGKRAPVASKPPPLPENISTMLQEIKTNITSDYSEALDQLTQLETVVSGTSYQNDVAQIIHNLDNFEEDLAQANLQTLEEKIQS
jgi:HPt (histidine-containing phosphotransfer) domain-containing protein